MAWFGRNSAIRVALEIAAAVKADHETHVKECRDRYLDTKIALDKIQTAVADVGRERESSRRLYGMMWVEKTAASTIEIAVAYYRHSLPRTAPHLRCCSTELFLCTAAEEVRYAEHQRRRSGR